MSIRPSLFAVSAASLLLASGCCRHRAGGGGGSQLVGVDGVPEASPSPLDFGTVGTGTTHSKGLVIKNSGSAPLVVSGAVVSGDASFIAAKVQKVLLAPGGTFTLNVKFAPASAGPHQASLAIATDSSELPTLEVPLKGTAFTYGLEASATELDFGDVQLQTNSAAQTLVVTNSSTSAEDIVVGPLQGASDFQLSPTGPQLGVAPGQTFKISVVYAPAITGPEEATLPISACEGCAPVTITLTGTGVDTQLVVVDADTNQPYVSFGTVPAGQTVSAHVLVQAASNPIGVAHPLTATLPSAPALEQGTAGFKVTPTDSSWTPTAWPGSLTPGPVATSLAFFVVSYTAPSGQSTATDVVDVPFSVGPVQKSPAKLPISAGLAASPCDQLSASPAAVGFGTVLAGKTALRSVTITNAGAQLCNLSNVGIGQNDPFGEFALQGGSIPQLALGAGQSQPLNVTFTPQSGTPPLLRTGTLTMQTSDPNVPQLTVPLSGSLQNAAYASSAWPKWHRDNGNTGLSSADASGNKGQLAWKIGIGAPVGRNGGFASYIHSPVIGLDPNSGHDLVYMLGYGSWQPGAIQAGGNGAGEFIAVDGPSGNQLWSTPLTGPEAAAQESTPTVVADNSIFLMTGGEQNSYPQFYHLGADGSILWSGVQAIGGQTFSCPFDPTGATDCSQAGNGAQVGDGFDTCPGFDSNGLLYLYDDDQPGCDSYDSTKGTGGAPSLIWSSTVAAPTNGGGNPAAKVESFSAALTGQSESVFAWGGLALALDAQGQELWNLSLGNGQLVTRLTGGGGPPPGGGAPAGGNCQNDSRGSPAIYGADAVVSFAGFDTSCTNIVGGLAAVNLQSGSQDWELAFPTLSPPAGASTSGPNSSLLLGYSSPATLEDGGLVVGYLDGVYAFDPPPSGSGQATLRWKVSTGLVIASPAVGGDGTVFVGSSDGNFYAIDSRTGTVRWSYAVGSAVNSSPAIGSDGSVYFAADDGNLYALR